MKKIAIISILVIVVLISTITITIDNSVVRFKITNDCAVYAEEGQEGGTNTNPFSSLKSSSEDESYEFKKLKNDIMKINRSIISLIQAFGNGIVVIALLMLGLSFIFARNKPAKLEGLKEWAKYIVVGAIIFFGVWNISFILYRLGSSLGSN